MTKIKLLFAFLVLWVMCVQAQPREIATFSRSNYAGWTYLNSSSVELTAQEIGRGRVTLFTNAKDGLVRELISPYITCSNLDALTVNVKYRTEYSYIADRVTLKVALCSLDGYEYGFTMTPVPAEEYDHDLTTVLSVPAGTAMCRLHFTAPYADVDNCGAIMEVHVFEGANDGYQSGDVNGDGIVDVDDVNQVINVILGISSSADCEGDVDVDGSGLVDVDDVNAVINKILLS